MLTKAIKIQAAAILTATSIFGLNTYVAPVVQEKIDFFMLTTAVEIKGVVGIGNHTGVGSGIEIEPGLIITAAHVVSGAKDLNIFDQVDGKIIKRNLKVKVAIFAPINDFAVLAHPLSDPKEVAVKVLAYLATNSAIAAEGDKIIAVGFAKGHYEVKTEQVATGETETVQTDLPNPIHTATSVGFSYPGMSGGPVFNEEGKLVGLVSLGSDKTLRDLVNNMDGLHGAQLRESLKWDSGRVDLLAMKKDLQTILAGGTIEVPVRRSIFDILDGLTGGSK